MNSSKWIYIGAIGFLVSVALSILYFYHGRQLFGSSLSIFYFILLFPLGISSAAFLFKGLNSYASFSGKYMGNELKLGGPVVMFCLVFAGGFYFYQHPPAQSTYTFSISFMDSTNLANVLKGSATISYGNEVNIKHPLENGAVVIKDATPGNAIIINPGIYGYFAKHGFRYSVPYPPDPLEIFMYEDQLVLGKMRELHSRISTALNNYVNDAKNFRELLSDTIYYIDLLQRAVDSLNTGASRYATSFTTLYVLRDSFFTANKKSNVIDTVVLQQAFDDFNFVHVRLFRDFDSIVRPMLIEYYNDKDPSIRKNIVDRIKNDVLNTSQKLNDLDIISANVKSSLNL